MNVFAFNSKDTPIFLNHPAAKLSPWEAVARCYVINDNHINCIAGIAYKLYVYHVNLSSILATLYPVCNH